jgi:hypothetical protein
MKNEIDKTHYCAGDFYSDGCFRWNENDPYGDGGCICTLEKCRLYRRKWPTPEQHKAEYGEEWPDDGAVYRLYTNNDGISTWYIERNKPLSMTNKNKFVIHHVVCACTPWGKPPDDWRPE